MPYPDDFNPAAFARHHGDERYDAALASAQDTASAPINLAAQIKARAVALGALLDQATALPELDHDLEDIRCHVGSLAGMDVDGWECDLIEAGMEAP